MIKIFLAVMLAVLILGLCLVNLYTPLVDRSLGKFFVIHVIPTQPGLHPLGGYEFIETRPSVIFIHGAKRGSPLDYRSFIKTYVGKFNIFVFSYDDSLPLARISGLLAKDFAESKKIYQGLDKATIVASSYGSIIARKAVVDNKEGLFRDVNITQLVPVLGGSSEAMGVYKFEPWIRSLIIEGNGVNWHTAVALDPLGPTQEDLFNKEACEKFLGGIRRTDIILVKKDINLPDRSNLSAFQETITTKKDAQRFRDLYENGLWGASSINIYDISTNNPHDDILRSTKAIAEVEKTVSNTALSGKRDPSNLREVKKAGPRNSIIHNIKRYWYQWLVEGAIVSTLHMYFMEKEMSVLCIKNITAYMTS